MPEAQPKTEHLYAVKVRKDNAAARITKNEAGNALDVVIDDVPFTTYHYEKEMRKFFLSPILSDNDKGYRVRATETTRITAV